MIEFYDFEGEEEEYVWAIIDRAEEMAHSLSADFDRLGAYMDLACVQSICPLKLRELAIADNSNFIHDVFGIRQHLNRQTGKLENCFIPRHVVTQ